MKGAQIVMATAEQVTKAEDAVRGLDPDTANWPTGDQVEAIIDAVTAPANTATGRLLPTEVQTITASQVQSGHAVELPRMVYLWQPRRSREGWLARFTANEPRLAYPTWHFVYDAFTVMDAGAEYAKDVDAEEPLNHLQERYVLWRIGTEHPGDHDDHEDLLLAVHEYELVRVQAIIHSTTEPGSM